MSGLPESKLSKLRRLWAVGDTFGAMQVAARFPQLGAQRAAILTAWGCLQNRRMYEQFNRDPDALIAAGLAALQAKYDLPAPPGGKNAA